MPPTMTAPTRNQDIDSITLENLPAELRLHILHFVSELGDLQAIVRASPVFHQQYLLYRRQLLGDALSVTLGSVLVDAQALQQSLALPEVGQQPLTVTKRLVQRHLAEYAALRGRPDAARAKCRLEDLTSMASFYLTVIQPLLAQLPPLLLQNLRSAPSMEPLSRTERTRWTRALYRVQLFYSLFRFNDPLERDAAQFSETDKIVLYFGIFEPWESEEIYSVYQAMGYKYARVLEDIPWDVGRFDVALTSPPYETGYFDLDQYNRTHLKEGTIATGGLGLFRRVLAASDSDELAKLMDANLAWCTVDSIANLMDQVAQDMARYKAPSERDQAEHRGDKLPFTGDREDGPPLAWVFLWYGRYSNSYGDYIPVSLRKFGYVFWDAERLEKMGGITRV